MVARRTGRYHGESSRSRVEFLVSYALQDTVGGKTHDENPTTSQAGGVRPRGGWWACGKPGWWDDVAANGGGHFSITPTNNYMTDTVNMDMIETAFVH
jgi:hypothetical protein